MLDTLHRRLIVSCQASEGDAFYSPDSMARFAKAALDGGAAGIRANGPADIAAIRQAVNLPIIGIQKRVQDDGNVLITPDFESARALVGAGAAAVALDCTARGQRYGALARLRQIKNELRVPVLADIATEEEAVAAAAAGADFVLSTMRGYSAETCKIRTFEPQFVARVKSLVNVPVIAEGMIATPAQARAAIDAGAWAVIAGTAITRPHSITRAFARAIAPDPSHYIGIDMGATNTKYGVVTGEGELLWSKTKPTPAQAGREALLMHLADVAAECRLHARDARAIGIATAGWVDTASGEVVFATDALRGWAGAVMSEMAGLPVFADNDARATLLGELKYGAARGCGNVVLLTLGTGVGGAIAIHGEVLQGASSLAGAIGQISNLDKHPEEASSVAKGLAAVIHILDPELVVIGGGHAQNAAGFFAHVERDLAQRVFAHAQRRLRVVPAAGGYYAGVVGAAALAKERML
ncbi:MAG: putative N-acetylmannosamine-6-phosphate 2-epimerase [Bryobacterales bacterium]|nr:putative N-acetylmannosamine-6-phosphate 2-epimerase [Bryobacterales bacterium]